jgi:hypothetical protein
MAAKNKISISKIWTNDTLYVGEGNKETVFAIKYTYLSNWNGNTDGAHWQVMNGVREQAIKKYGYGSGWGANTVLPQLYNAFEANDTRKAASIIACKEEKTGFSNFSGAREYTGYYLKKYTPLGDSVGKDLSESKDFGSGVSFMLDQFQDYVAIRYSDVLLMAAELGSANAQNYFDRVRKRAGLASVPVTTDAIRAERRFEFVGEGVRYWDLLRYGLDYAATAISISTTVLNGNIEEPLTIDGANIKTTKGLQQIPLSQITLSGNTLTQNPGWE